MVVSCSDGAVAAAARVYVPGAQLPLRGSRVTAGRGGAAAAAGAAAPCALRRVWPAQQLPASLHRHAGAPASLSGQEWEKLPWEKLPWCASRSR